MENYEKNNELSVIGRWGAPVRGLGVWVISRTGGGERMEGGDSMIYFAGSKGTSPSLSFSSPSPLPLSLSLLSSWG